MNVGVVSIETTYVMSAECVRSCHVQAHSTVSNHSDSHTSRSIACINYDLLIHDLETALGL